MCFPNSEEWIYQSSLTPSPLVAEASDSRGHCYGLNVCVFLKFICGCPNPQHSGIYRWGLWAVMGLRRGHEGGDPHNGIRVLMRRGGDQSSLALHHVRILRGGGHPQAGRTALAGNPICLHFDLRLLSLRPVVSAPSLWCFVVTA